MSDNQQETKREPIEGKAPRWMMVLYWALAVLLPVVFLTPQLFVFFAVLVPWVYLIYLLVVWLLSRLYRTGMTYVRWGESPLKRTAAAVVMLAPFVMLYGLSLNHYWLARPVRLNEAAVAQLYHDNKEALHRIDEEILGVARDGVAFVYFRYNSGDGVICHTEEEMTGTTRPSLPLGEVEQLSQEEKELVENFFLAITPRRMYAAMSEGRLDLYGLNNIQARYVKGDQGWGGIYIPDGGWHWPNTPGPTMPPDESAIPLDNGG